MKQILNSLRSRYTGNFVMNPSLRQHFNHGSSDLELVYHALGTTNVQSLPVDFEPFTSIVGRLDVGQVWSRFAVDTLVDAAPLRDTRILLYPTSSSTFWPETILGTFFVVL